MCIYLYIYVCMYIYMPFLCLFLSTSLRNRIPRGSPPPGAKSTLLDRSCCFGVLGRPQTGSLVRPSMGHRTTSCVDPECGPVARNIDCRSLSRSDPNETVGALPLETTEARTYTSRKVTSFCTYVFLHVYKQTYAYVFQYLLIRRLMYSFLEMVLDLYNAS